MPYCSYGLEVKVPEERHHTKMYKKLQDEERVVKEIHFICNSGRLKQDFLDTFKGVKSDVLYAAKLIKIVIKGLCT